MPIPSLFKIRVGPSFHKFGIYGPMSSTTKIRPIVSWLYAFKIKLATTFGASWNMFPAFYNKLKPCNKIRNIIINTFSFFHYIFIKISSFFLHMNIYKRSIS